MWFGSPKGPNILQHMNAAKMKLVLKYIIEIDSSPIYQSWATGQRECERKGTKKELAGALKDEVKVSLINGARLALKLGLGKNINLHKGSGFGSQINVRGYKDGRFLVHQSPARSFLPEGGRH